MLASRLIGSSWILFHVHVAICPSSNVLSCFDIYFFFFSSRRRHTRSTRDWSSDVCSSDLTSKPARLSALQRMLLETQRKGGTSLLLVDEAHLLTPELLEEIRLLSNADTYQDRKSVV